MLDDYFQIKEAIRESSEEEDEANVVDPPASEDVPLPVIA